MFTLQISYPVRDYEAFKNVFDSDPAGRAASGARSVRLFRDTEDQNSVAVLLDFDTKDAATGFLEKLRSQVWDRPEVIGQLMTAAPTARILEEVAREGQGAG
jgi:heme-degrading monooxygenase HmoA